MGESDAPRPESSWGEKVLALHEELARRRIPYAFGGAIALNYHREPRSTLDIDINVFVAPERQSDVTTALTDLFRVSDPAKLSADLLEHGQARTLWEMTFIDLFLANTDFHASMAQRVRREPFGEAEIPVLSIEDLLICKILFDRPKDWLDLAAVAQTRRGELDDPYIRSWASRFLADDDARFKRWQAILEDSR